MEQCLGVALSIVHRVMSVFRLAEMLEVLETVRDEALVKAAEIGR